MGNTAGEKLKQLIEAEKKAAQLFLEIEKRLLIKAGISESDLNEAVYDLAFEMFGIRKYWHKRIVRAGKNTLLPYRHNPKNLTIQEDDILFFDFGPVFEAWEADFGRTFVLGNNQEKIKLKTDIEKAWLDGKSYYDAYRETITGSDLYAYTLQLAKKYKWAFGNEHCGHLIGNFPHELIQGEEVENYIHPDNHLHMSAKDKNGNDRFWIYEIHFIDPFTGIGGFYEQLLS